MRNTKLWASISCGVLFTATAIAQAPEPGDLEQQLEEARAQLEAAAEEVAELSGRMGNEQMFRFYKRIGPEHRGSMLGIIIGTAGGAGDSNGVTIMGVSPNGPADKSGLKTGDILTGINGESLAGSSGRESRRKLFDIMGGVEPAATVTVQYLRDGKAMTADVDTHVMQPQMFNLSMAIDGEGDHAWAGNMPDFVRLPGMPFFSAHLIRHWGDLELVALSPELGRYFGTAEGVLVVNAPDEEDLQIQDGDVILSIDSRIPKDPNHALRILRSYASGETLSIEIMRDKRRSTLEVTIPENGADENARIIRPGPAFAPGPARIPRAPRPGAPPV